MNRVQVSSIMEKAVENGLDERGEINDFEHVSSQPLKTSNYVDLYQ